MNPEFQRQLWLRCSNRRLVQTPAVLLLLFIIIFISSPGLNGLMLSVASLFLIGYCWLVGPSMVGNSISEETAQKTWDQQRMSAMTPWSMTWGKVLGASAYSWYTAGLCLLVVIPCALNVMSEQKLISLLLCTLCIGLSLQALQLSLHLQFLKINQNWLRSRYSAFGLLLVIFFIFVRLLDALSKDNPMQHWWGQEISLLALVLGSVLLLTLICWLMAWRCMAEALSVRQLPWGWPLLALTLSGYLAGFADNPSFSLFCHLSLISSSILSYLSLLTQSESNVRALWQRIGHSLQRQQWRSALLYLPSWSASLLLAWVFVLFSSLSPQQPQILPLDLGQNAWQPLLFALLLTRDAGLILFLHLNPNQSQPMRSLGVIMLILYALPLYMLQFDSQLLRSLILPLGQDGVSGLLVALLQLGIMGGLLFTRWRNTRPAFD